MNELIKTDWGNSKSKTASEALTKMAESSLQRSLRPEGFCCYCGSKEPFEAHATLEGSRVKFKVNICCKNMESHVKDLLSEPGMQGAVTPN